MRGLAGGADPRRGDEMEKIQKLYLLRGYTEFAFPHLAFLPAVQSAPAPNPIPFHPIR